MHIRVAYNGMKAAHPKFTKLQIKIQRLGYDVMKLCDKSAVTVPKFKRTSGMILTDLQTAYKYTFSMDMKAWVFVHMLTPPP